MSLSDARDGAHAALWVTADVPWATRETPVRVPLATRADERHALWTARVSTLKRALVAALRADPDETTHCDSDVFLAVIACSRCGRPSGCRCGWRCVHTVPTALETRSLAQLVARVLPLSLPHGDRAPPQSLHVRLIASNRPPLAWLEAEVTQFKIVDPMVERPRAVFKIHVMFGPQSWSVARRFKEFVVLHAALAGIVAPNLLPMLPGTTWFRRLDDDFLQARRKALHQYVSCLLLIDCVRDSVVMLSFLGALSTTQETLLLPEPDSLCPKEVLHLRVLQYYVRPGDLVLFQSRGIVSSLQRAATGSDWDHVGIVVPRSREDDSKGYLLLEATGDGVTALSLASRLYAYSTYHTRRIALRQLRTPLLTDLVRAELLDRFTETVNGRPYGLSLSKVLRTNEPQANGNAIGSDFFCSELIADAYKALGLIEPKIPSSNFWPSSFASGAFVDVEIGRHEIVEHAVSKKWILASDLEATRLFMPLLAKRRIDLPLPTKDKKDLIGMKKLFKLPSKYHGPGRVVFAWQPDGGFLATAGKNGLVHIFDRQGEQYDEIGLDMSSPVIALEWDPEGGTLAILQQGSSIVPLWSLSSRQTNNVDTNLKDPSFLKWSATGAQLAVGTHKGNLVLYYKATRKIVPVLGKHSKRITAGAWNAADQLVLGSEDKMLTVNNAKGDTIEMRELSLVPVEIKFGRKRGDSMKAAEQLVAISITRSIILFNLQDPGNPIELTFQAHYGSIVFFDWYGDGLILIAFSEGYVIVISTRIDEIGEEVFSGRFFSERIYSACYSTALNRTAVSGDSGIKVIDMAELKEITSDAVKLTDNEENEATMMSFTSDGQILTVATHGGNIQNFLARMPKIFDYYSNYVAYLSSLRELSVVDVLGRDSPIHIAVSIEPSFVTLGPRHVAVGMNNRVWYYRCDGRSNDALVNEQQYLGRVTSVKLNRDYACVLFDGKASLHLIEPGAGGHADLQEEQGKVFSSSSGGGRDERNSEISAIALTKDFFIYSTSNGTGSIHFFYLNEWKILDGCSYRHDEGAGIVSIAPNRDGTRVVFMDSRRQGYILHAPTREALHVAGIRSTTNSILWDTVDPNVFVALQPRELSLFLYTDFTVSGPEVTQLGMVEINDGELRRDDTREGKAKEGDIKQVKIKIKEGELTESKIKEGDMKENELRERRIKEGAMEEGEVIIIPMSTPIPPDVSPILVCDGVITCQHASGKLTSFTSCTHDHIVNKSNRGAPTAESERAMFRQNLGLLRLDAAWKLACRINVHAYWLALAGYAMKALDIGVAKRAYRQIGDAGMVLGLDRIENIEEKNLLAGHVSILFGDYSEARRLFLDSSDPMAALHMQRHLLQWDQALKLADSLAIELVPELSVAYATQLEFKGEFEGALKMYEHATNVSDERGNNVQCSDKLRQQSLAGVARCTFRLGDLRRGIRLVADAGDVNLYKECAVILEGMKQHGDAAVLYEKGEMYEKVAQIYIQMKNLAKAAPLMPKVKTPKIHSQYGRAKEGLNDFNAAAEAYAAAGDMDSVVRIQLENLHNPESAFSIVRETKSSEGALAVAKYCTETGNYKCAIEFLLMANKEDEAFVLAMSHGEVDAFAQQLGERISVERAGKIAQHYEQTQAHSRAAEFYQICGNYHKALKLFLQCGDSELSKAIEVVGKARNDMLTHTLIDHLMGETDGIPKDPNYIFRLYMALGQYAQAAKTAIIISRQEQELGNYKVAHDVLVETHRQLESHKIHVSQDLRTSLMLLHSYILVKKLVKRGDHVAAARMLVRVAKHISKFPTHVSNILISAVIECQRAGLKAYSYDYATTLMKPEYRNTIDKEIKRKIEAIVRRPNKEQPPDPVTPCPFCASDLPEAELDCSKCKNWVPYCIVTGYHMVKEDWSKCPRCAFPGLHAQFRAHLETDPTCPMCEQPLEPSEIQRALPAHLKGADDETP